MKTGKLILSLFLMSLFSYFCPISIYGDVEIKVEANKKVVLQGEPFLLTVHLSNKGSKIENIPWWGREFYSNKESYGKVLINGESLWHAMRPPGKPTKKTAPYRLKPGEEISEKFIILFSGIKNKYKHTIKYKYTLKETKQYKIRLRYGSTYTDPLKVTVNNPRSEVDKTVWNKYLKNKGKHSYSRLIHAPWQLNTKYSVTKKDRKLFHNIIEQYPDSTYTPYIAFSLARNHSARSVYDEENRVQLKKKAKKLFKKTLELTDNKMLTEFTKEELKKLEKKERDKREFWVGK